MYDAKNNDKDRKGSVSYTLGDRKYFGQNLNSMFEAGKGYYGNVHHNIFSRFK